jgi:hypothetical protein
MEFQWYEKLIALKDMENQLEKLKNDYELLNDQLFKHNGSTS